MDRAGNVHVIPGAVLGAYRREDSIMSAFLVSAEHIAALVKYGRDHDVSVYLGEGMVDPRLSLRKYPALAAFMLYRANVEAVEARYPGADDMVWYRFNEGSFTMADVPSLSAVEVLKACDCFEYQACEWPEWEGSGADRLLWAIRKAAIHNLPGYDDAAWEVKARGPRMKLGRAAA